CIERLVVAAKTLLARRAAESGRWRAKGDRSPAHWLARTTGTSVGQARATLETAERLRELPATEEALRAGKLSATQASVITDAARRAGRQEPAEAYAFDALLAMARAATGAPGARPPVKVIVRIDHTALVRGHTVAGETCEMAGVGPVPVAVVEELMGDAFL